MKFTLSWLKDHLDTDATLEEMERVLSLIGLEVEAIENPAEKLGGFTIARIVEAAKHPDADRLKVCQVEIAPGEKPVEVVCGAPNAKTGLIGVFAPLGAYIPGTGLTLEKRPVRGVVSNGMLLSEREMELSDAHDGIVELDSSYAEAIGQPYIDVTGANDPIIEIAITPNRPDCTGVRGVARDLAAAGLGTLKPEPKLGSVDGDYDCPVPIALEFPDHAADACPIFAGRYIRGVQNGASPDWMKKRLEAVGQKTISALVDMTNYVSIDRGRPLHVYDADKLHGTISARLGAIGEHFLALDSKTYDVDDGMCVIADDIAVLGLGGIIGGDESSCTPETTNVLIECAYFDPLRIAITGRKCGVSTDARYRFERGVDPEFVEPGLDLATDLVLKLCGGEPSRAKIAGAAPDGKRTVAFDLARVEKLTGVAVPPKRAAEILTAIGCEIEGGPSALKTGTSVSVTTPSWRPDMHGTADLVEEVIRIVGLDNVPAVPMPRPNDTTKAVLTDQQKRARRTRRVLASRGLVEAITWSFIPEQQAAAFGIDDTDSLSLSNPISIELSTMRPSLLPGLLSAAQRNKNRGFADACLFELGQAYRDPTQTGQQLLASGVRIGTGKAAERGRHWSGNANAVDVFDVKEDAAAVLAALGIDMATVQITRDAPSWYHPGKSGVIRRGPKVVLATFGELHPQTLKDLDVDAPAAAFEIDLGSLPPVKRSARARPAMETVDLLPVRRDFAFTVTADVDAGTVVRAARGADKALISHVQVFDVFEGASLGDGRKSLAIEVTLQPTGATLTDGQIEAVSQKVIAAVAKATGAEIRG
ncbi:MAG: phenylalanine--tRNA ligase subunit beta [Pseudomonadota bacterium]